MGGKACKPSPAKEANQVHEDGGWEGGGGESIEEGLVGIGNGGRGTCAMVRHQSQMSPYTHSLLVHEEETMMVSTS